MSYTDDGKVIANNIRAERNRVKLSQQEVSDKLKISTKTYLTYEKDASNITAKHLLQLSKLFNCNITSFFII